MNSGFTQEKVDKLADLLLIGLTEEENKMVLDEFDTIDKNINLINEIEGIENVEPMSHCLDDFVVELTSDEAEESVSIEELLKNADEVVDRQTKLPKVVG